jgi:D-galactose 1-dehydrogenase
MTRIGLIGFGEIARKRHLPAITANAAFELAAIADPHGDSSGLDVPGFTSHVEMLSAIPDLDAAAICTPPRARTRVALDAIAAGVHVLIEKPPTSTVAESLLLRDAAERAGRVLFASWHSQYNEAVDRMREILAGEIVDRVSIIWEENFEKYHPGQDWIWRRGGFGVFDMAINGLSILTRILPQRAYARECDLVFRDGEDTPIAARVKFGIGDRADGSGEAEFDWRAADDRREITVTTRRGKTLRLLDSGRRLLAGNDEVAAGPSAEYPVMYERFAELLRARRSDVDLEPLILACDSLQIGRRAL